MLVRWQEGLHFTTEEPIYPIKNLSKKLLNFKILYGGSVNSINSRQICNINSVDGALIGGASLKIEAFNQIIS